MLFSFTLFIIILPIIFILYWYAGKDNLKFQNRLLLATSYYFYSCWDWRFLFLILFSTLLDFYTGLKIQNTQSVKKRKYWLVLSLIINLGFLGIFKYYNFFTVSFLKLFNVSNLSNHFLLTNIILPIGISFYTFHGLSYVFDVYYRKRTATSNFVNYSLFVSFFPLLLAGPIERATHLLPQIEILRNFDLFKAKDGLRQILWGFFKKLVIADNCATYVNLIFNHSNDYNSNTLIIGAVLFSFQIYSDFSGYSDIAAGLSKLFGFDIIQNFSTPYFSKSISEFWRRWHISLSTWFRDYVYIPLGGNRYGTTKTIVNLIITFLLSGLWHGANWTFIIWGSLNALYYITERFVISKYFLFSKYLKNHISKFIYSILQTVFTFILITFGWIFFRSESLNNAKEYIVGIFYKSKTQAGSLVVPPELYLLITVFLLIEWAGKDDMYTLRKTLLSLPTIIRWIIYYLIIFIIIAATKKGEEFIYFHF